MATLILDIPEEVLLEVTQAAHLAQTSVDDIIITRLIASSGNNQLAAEFDGEAIAHEVHAAASHFKVGDEYTVEELHRLAFGLAVWKSRTTGQRISIGRAFGRLVDAGVRFKYLNDTHGTVKFLRKDAQNRAIYTNELARL